MTRYAILGVLRASEMSRLPSGEPGEAVAAGEVAALCWPGPIAAADRLARIEAAEARCHALLPVAGGALAAEEIRPWLAARAGALVSALGRVAGRVEIDVTWPENPPAAAEPARGASGRDWLAARAGAHAKVEARRAAAVARARALAGRIAPRPAAGRLALQRGGGLDLSLLVPRESSAATIAALRDDPASAGALVTGPWPCFSFADLPEAA